MKHAACCLHVLSIGSRQCLESQLKTGIACIKCLHCQHATASLHSAHTTALTSLLSLSGVTNLTGMLHMSTMACSSPGRRSMRGPNHTLELAVEVGSSNGSEGAAAAGNPDVAAG